jgi:hypothetical protein
VLLGRGDGTFQEQRRLDVGDRPSSLVVADLNGDGRPDLVTANGASANVSVLLGRGDGTFQEQRRFAVGDSPSSLVVADLNGDGHPDLAIANFFSNNVSVLLGRGDGTFQEQRRLDVGDRPSSLAVADLNGDRRPDLAVANRSSNDVSVLLGRGGGTFQEQERLAVGDRPSSLVVADLNGDHRADLAVTNFFSGDVSVLLGRGDGTFQEQRRLDVGDRPSSLVVADLNGDGRPDLATANRYSADVSVLLGLGDATFQEQPRLALGTVPYSLVVADLNGDGRPDLATANGASDDVSVKLNFVGEMFASPGPFATASHATPLLADLEQDGADDALVVNQAGEILWRKGRPQEPGTFEPPVIVNPSIPSRDFVIFDSYQGPLIASVDAQANAVSLFALRDGRFVRIGSLLTGSLPAQIAAADLNGDGFTDLVVRNAGDGTASVYLGDGCGNFRKLLDDLTIGLGASDIRLADVDQSGTIDLIVTNRSTGDVRVLYSRGDASFTPGSRYHAGIGPYGLVVDAKGMPTLVSLEETAGVAVGTFTRRVVPGAATVQPLPVLDLVTINPGSNTLGVLEGLGGGAFSNPRRILTDRPIEFVRAADFDGNGVTDVALLGAGLVTISLGDGQGAFNAPISVNAGPNPTGLSLADVDQDGSLDLLVGNDFGDLLVLLGNGDGTFRPFQKADRGVALAVADLNDDGRDDFVFASQDRDRVVVEFGGAGTTVVDDRSNGLIAPGAVALSDLNRDGRLDLIVANSGSNNVLIYLGQEGNVPFGPAVNGGNGFFTGTNPVALEVVDLTIDNEGNGDGIPDLVVTNNGSNDVTVLFGEGRGDDWTLLPGTRYRSLGIGAVSTLVQDIDNDGKPDLLISNSQTNDVRQIPQTGLGSFDNVMNARTIPVGNNPGPSIPGNFDNRPGLDVVVPDRSSNTLTVIPNIADGASVPFRISSGGNNPGAGFARDFDFDGFSDLVIANRGDGRLALFLGGGTGLSLSQSFTSSAVPHPTALAFDSVSDGLLSFYASTEGLEAATLLSFTLAGGREGPSDHPPLIFPGPGPGSPGTPAPGPTEQVARLVPLRESALALVATLLTVALNTSMPTTEADAVAAPVDAATLGTFSATATAAPTQSVSPPEDPHGVADAADAASVPPADTQDVPQSEQVPAWVRFVEGLAEGFDRRRRASLADLPTGVASPSLAARILAALDALLDRWTPGERDEAADRPGLTEGLRQAADPMTRVLDAAIDLLWSEAAPSAPALELARSPEPQDVGAGRPEETDPEEVSSVSVSLALVSALLVRRAWPPRRERHGCRIVLAAGHLGAGV